MKKEIYTYFTVYTSSIIYDTYGYPLCTSVCREKRKRF